MQKTRTRVGFESQSQRAEQPKAMSVSGAYGPYGTILTLGLPGGVWLYGYMYFFQRHFFPRVFFRIASVYLTAIHFHIFWCTNLEKMLLPRESVYQKVECLRGSPQISAARRDRNEISKTISMFSRSSYPIKLTAMLSDQTGSGNFNRTIKNIVRPNRKAERREREPTDEVR